MGPCRYLRANASTSAAPARIRSTNVVGGRPTVSVTASGPSSDMSNDNPTTRTVVTTSWRPDWTTNGTLSPMLGNPCRLAPGRRVNVYDGTRTADESKSPAACSFNVACMDTSDALSAFSHTPTGVMVTSSASSSHASAYGGGVSVPSDWPHDADVGWRNRHY